MIEKLNRGLTVEVVFVAAFIGLAFRSPLVMLASILPAIFPIVVAGTMLWLLGDGLQFASVIALTVSFGLGMSATIHFLNRLRLEEKRRSRCGGPARHLVGRSAIDPDIGCALMRTCRNGVFQFAVASHVWLA
jgi:predicted RND superfamily exporter protein